MSIYSIYGEFLLSLSIRFLPKVYTSSPIIILTNLVFSGSLGLLEGWAFY